MPDEKQNPWGAAPDFWDISALVPPRAKGSRTGGRTGGDAAVTPPRPDTEAVLITVPTDAEERPLFTASVSSDHTDIAAKIMQKTARAGDQNGAEAAPHGNPIAPHNNPIAPHGTQIAPHDTQAAPHDAQAAPHNNPIAPHNNPIASHNVQAAPHNNPIAPHGAENAFSHTPHGAASVGASVPAVHLMSEKRAVMAGDVPLPRREVMPDAALPVATPERVWHPDSGFLREVRVFAHGHPHTYYAAFAAHAKKLKDFEGREVPHVPFFSYMPQYTQLTRPQLAYYFWWRTSFQRGVLLPADYSYLLLYVFEIINLGDAIDPKTGQENLQKLWLAYRDRYPRLDGILREWLCDYALLHGLISLPLPQGQLSQLVAEARLKEFYIGAGEGESLCDAVLAFATNYDYRKSKFYRAEAKALFDRVLRGAAMLALSHLLTGNEVSDMPLGHSTVTRESFSGAICVYAQKKRIEVDFLSFSHTYRLRYVLTDVLKYAENALRAHLGVKSRLSIYEVPNELRAALDAYFEKTLPPKVSRTGAKKSETPPDYEQRYELPRTALSFDRAAQIESASWQTTARLMEAFGQETATDETAKTPSNASKEPITVSKTPVFAPSAAAAYDLPKPTGASTPPSPSTPLREAPADRAMHPLGAPVTEDNAAAAKGDTLRGALGDLAAFLPLADRGDTAAMRRFAAARGLMLDAVADRINSAAAECLGDIILEDNGGTWQIVEDYRADLESEGIV